MDTVVKKQLKHEKCILDGEMVVWNKTRFAPLPPPLHWPPSCSPSL